jgi:hypothetical protein
MAPFLAFAATAVATLFAQATLKRYTETRAPHQLAWTIALAMFVAAAAACALGLSTGWDPGTYRVFYCFGAILNVVWLALGTLLLLAPGIGRRAAWGVVAFSGLAAGVMLATSVRTLPFDTIPVGREVLEPLPRVFAAIASGVGALVVFGGAAWSAARYLRRRGEAGAARMASANALIALGVLVLSSGGLAQGLVGHDTAFSLSLVTGISVIYAGFAVSSRSSRRNTLPTSVRGSSPTISTRVGHL